MSRPVVRCGRGAGGTIAAGCVALLLAGAAHGAAPNRPNVVLVMADDLGWRDVGYQGSPHAKTPVLDEMAARGVRFDYFYPAQQMCSPGRFGLITGRTPFRTGLHALGAMRPQEITLAKALKTVGYRTAHFGKWHLGSKETSPAKMGFDHAVWKLNYFDLGASLQVGDTSEQVKLEGDTSVATMDLAVAWLKQPAADKTPFFVQVCFGSPHSPHQAAEEFKALYADLPEGRRDFYGEISGVDAAVGRLRKALRDAGVADDTLLWFCSDNGGITPLSQDPTGKGKMSVGNRTASVLEWPGRIRSPLRTEVPAAHMDVYPTVLEIVGVTMPNQPVLDGTSLLPLFEGKMATRPKPLGFLLRQGSGEGKGPGKKKGGDGGGLDRTDFVKHTQGVWIDGRLKLIVGPAKEDGGAGPAQLYDIYDDPAHKTDLAEKRPEDVARMRTALDIWRQDVRASYDGRDFAEKK